MQAGGNLFVAVDPNADHGLGAFLEKAGAKLSNNYVITVMQTAFGRVADPSATQGTEFSNTNSITKVFGKNEFVLFRMPQAIEQGTLPTGVTFESIVKGGENSFAYPDNKFEGEGKQGNFTLVAALKGQWPSGTKEFQLVVAGDGDFLNNQMLYRNLNRDLMLNSVLTLAKEENLVSITPKEITATELSLTENKFYIFVFAFVIPLPLLMLIASGTLWYRRRNA
jgi:hypothetical protein